MPVVFLEKPFQLSVCLWMCYSSQDRLDTMSFKVFFENAIPSAVFVDSVGAKFAAVIHYQFSHRKKPPLSLDHLSQDLFAILRINIRELPVSKYFPGCIIQNNADLDVGSIHFIPVDMSC
jgi:hypothetical protein